MENNGFNYFSALLQSDVPSVGLENLRLSGQLKDYPALYDLVGCPQNPIKHPEGDAWQHTLNVVDAAAQLKENVPEEWRIAFMFGALLHDVGKPSTTTPELTAYKHDAAGAPIAEAFMQNITDDSVLIGRVASLVLCHMRPFGLVRDNASDKAWRKLNALCPLNVLAYISQADASGKGKGIVSDNEATRICLQKSE